jgi:hypothetical protein
VLAIGTVSPDDRRTEIPICYYIPVQVGLIRLALRAKIEKKLRTNAVVLEKDENGDLVENLAFSISPIQQHLHRQHSQPWVLLHAGTTSQIKAWQAQ